MLLLWNGVIILPCVTVSAPLFALLVLLNLISSWSCDCSSLKLENGINKHVRNITEMHYEFVKLLVIFFLVFTRCDYEIPSEISQTWAMLHFRGFSISIYNICKSIYHLLFWAIFAFPKMTEVSSIIIYLILAMSEILVNIYI